MKSDPDKKLAYTIEEAAELLSLSRAHIYRLIDLCEIGSIQIGRSRRITRGQLEAFVRAREQAACTTPATAIEIARRVSR